MPHANTAAYQLAQLNIARLSAPIDSPQLSDFVDNIDRINCLAESSAGFVQRVPIASDDPEAHALFGPDYVVNLSVWQDANALYDFVYRHEHLQILRRKQEWFQSVNEAHMVLWWVPSSHCPDLVEASERLATLRKLGPHPEAFTFRKRFDPPNPGDRPAQSVQNPSAKEQD